MQQFSETMHWKKNRVSCSVGLSWFSSVSMPFYRHFCICVCVRESSRDEKRNQTVRWKTQYIEMEMKKTKKQLESGEEKKKSKFRINLPKSMTNTSRICMKWCCAHFFSRFCSIFFFFYRCDRLYDVSKRFCRLLLTRTRARAPTAATTAYYRYVCQ